LYVPAVNKTAGKILNRHNFRITSPAVFMRRGMLSGIRFHEIFSFAGMGSTEQIEETPFFFVMVFSLD
jgi:hypothetical protein